MYEHGIEMILVLMALSIGVTAIAKKLNKPYPIALVIIGAVIGFLPFFELFGEIREFFATEEVFRTAVIAIFLPALLGEAALKLSITHIRENLRPILFLAFLGTLMAYAVTGTLVYTVMGLSLSVSLVYAALMAPTDPVSVISIFKTMGVNRRLAVVMEGESLINDGVAVVLFKISAFSLAAILEMGSMGMVFALTEFVKVVAGGTIVGLTLGVLISQVLRLFDDYPLEIAFSVLLFYGAYFIAEYFAVSGVIAVVAAGLVLGNYGIDIGTSPTTRLSINVFWDTLTLIANSLVFILVGLELTSVNIFEHLTTIFIAILIVLAGRSAAVYLSTIGAKLPFSWKHVLNWGGLKGSLSLALVLSLPHGFVGREILLVITFGVVSFSLLVQGLTVSPLLKMLGIRKMVEGLKEYEDLSFEMQQALSAEKEVSRLYAEGRVSPRIYDVIRAELNRRKENVDHSLNELYNKYPDLLKQQEFEARKKILIAEHQAVERLLNEGILSYDVGNEKQRLILGKLEALEEGDVFEKAEESIS